MILILQIPHYFPICQWIFFYFKYYTLLPHLLMGLAGALAESKACRSDYKEQKSSLDPHTIMIILSQ